MGKIKDYFCIEELVDKTVFDKYGEAAWKFIDKDLLACLLYYLYFSLVCILKIPNNIQINIIGYFFLCVFKDLLVGIWCLVD